MSNKNFNEFVGAICEGQTEEVREHLDRGMDPNGKENLRDYEYPLSQALFNKQFEIADMLLEAGAKPRYGAAFLDDYLDQKEYEPYVDRILEDACPEISENIQKAFLKALEIGNQALAERLWELCPPPDEFTIRRTPLCEMICEDHEEMALWMLDLGFDHTNINENEAPPARLAVLADHPRVLQKLFDLGESPELRVSGHQTKLAIARQYSKHRHVRDFPKNDKYEVFHEGNLLHVAAVAGSPKCAQLLLDAGLDPNEKDSEGRTPAQLAAIGGEATSDVLKLLPEPDLTDGSALVDLLTRSVLNDDIEGLQRAIDNGVDLSLRIKSPQWLEETPFLNESTPLIFAAGRGSVELLKTLIDAGADLEQDDWPEGEKRDASGLKYMIEHSSFETLLQNPMMGGRTPLGWAALAGEAEAMKFLIKAGADTQARDIFDFTVLHLAAMSDKPAAVEVALDLGIDLHAAAMDKMTPLHIAAAVNAVKAIPMLIEAGADTTIKNKQGETPYVTAKEWGKPGARNKLEPHTPKEFQKKKRKTKKKEEPDWEWSREEFEALLKRVRKSHGKEAKKLVTKKFRNQLAKVAKSEEFRATAEEVRKKLKAEELSSWDDSPHLLWMEIEKITSARLLKLQQEFLEKGVFVVRGLSSFQDTLRVFVVPTTKPSELLGAFGINGVNMGFDPELTVAWLWDLYDRHPYRVIGINYDGIQFRLNEPIKEPNDLVQELMIGCPPEMEETESLKALRKKLKSKTPDVFLWWD